MGSRSDIESGTTTASEKQKRTQKYPALCEVEYTHAGARYLFLCNSSKKPIGVRVEGAAKASNAFDGQPAEAKDVRLEAWEVKAIKVE